MAGEWRSASQSAGCVYWEANWFGDGSEGTGAMVSTWYRQVKATSGLTLVLMTLTGGCGGGTDLGPSMRDTLFFTFTELKAGMGPVAVDGDVVTIDYVAWLHDEDEADDKGQQVDSGVGLEFVLGGSQVIEAFDTGVVGMKVGGERRLVVPPNYALGGTGSGSIPGGSALVIDVTLLNLQPLVTDSAPFSITDLRVGTGAEAVDGATVSVAYAGWLYDASQPDGKGVAFETSDSNGLSFTLGTGDVIAGFDQGIVGMKVGGERRLIIPPELAYGETSQGLIPVNATLVFDVTLVSVE